MISRAISILFCMVALFGCAANKNGPDRYSESASLIEYRFNHKSDVANLPSGYESAIGRKSGQQRANKTALENGKWTITEYRMQTVYEPRLVRTGVVNEESEQLVPVKQYRGIVRFRFNSSHLEPAAVDELKKAPLSEADSVVIDAHTDGRGTDKYNEQLSEKRAEAVKAYLVSAGMPASMISVHAHGETEPVATNDDEEGRALNRRATIFISMKDEAKEQQK